MKPRIRILEDTYEGPLWSPQIEPGFYISTIYAGFVKGHDGKYSKTHSYGVRTRLNKADGRKEALLRHESGKTDAYRVVFNGLSGPLQ